MSWFRLATYCLLRSVTGGNEVDELGSDLEADPIPAHLREMSDLSWNPPRIPDDVPGNETISTPRQFDSKRRLPRLLFSAPISTFLRGLAIDGRTSTVLRADFCPEVRFRFEVVRVGCRAPLNDRSDD